MFQRNPEFADVDMGSLGFGALGGAGAEQHYQARAELDPNRQGVWYGVACDNCGQPNKVLIEWGEFIYGANRVVPPGWAHEQRIGAMHPNAACKQCRALILLAITPDECQRQLKAGVMASQISEQQIGQLSQQLAAQRAQQPFR